MSLMKTLAKVAIGVAVAKGAAAMANGGATRRAAPTRDDGLFGGRHSPNQSSGGTGLEGMMDSILGGGTSSAGSAGSAGGLGGMLEQLAGAKSGGAGGGLGDLLGGLAGGAGAGGLGGLLGGLAGATQGRAAEPEGSFGDVFNSQFDSTPEPAKKPTVDQEALAALMLSAMLQAAKSDGKFDAAEQKKLMDKLGDVDEAERAFVNAEMQKPVDVHALCHQVPQGMEGQIYMMSVLGIDLDTQEEAKYLHELASELRISKEQVNQVHDKMGVPRIYS